MPLSFEDWLELVDLKVQELTGGEVFLDDLPDWNSAISFENGDSPTQGARKAIKNAGEIGDW
jgi:hypothetical protein